FTDESTNNPKGGYIDIVVYDTTSSLTIPGAQNAYSMNFGGGVPTGATASLEIKWTSVGDLDGRDYFKCGSSILYTTSAITSPYPNTKTTDVTSCVAGENLSTGTLIHTNNAWNTGGYYYGLAGGHSVMEYARLTVTYVKSSPLLISLSPADGGSNIVSSTDFVMYFDRATYVGTGNITIKKTSDDSTVETIDVTGDKVTGTGTSVITIDPSTLGSDTAYYIQIDSTAFNDNSGNNYAGISDTTSWNFSTIDFTPPTTQASNLVFSSVLADSMTVSWTNGNGDGRIVFMKQASSGTAEPVDATNYTANAAFGSGTQISSTGWYTVYKGTGTSVDITGLTPTNDYILQVFEYDLGDSDPLFLTDTATNNPKSQATPNVTEPGTQATNLTFSSIDYTTMTVSWSNGNGEKRVVFAKQASTGTTTPVDDTAYTANTSFGSGTQIGSTGWYTVYSGTGSSVDVTGLTVEKDYIFQVFEYNSSGAYYNYNANTGTNNPKSQATANVLAPTTQASSTSFSTILNSSFTISWSSGNGDGRVVFVKQANSGTALPVADTTYTSSTSFGSGTQIGSTGWYTVYNDTGSSVTVTGLSSSTDYIAQVFEYTSFDSNIEFNTNTGSGNPATTTTIALVAPTTQASNVSFSSITASGATVSWTNGNGSNRVVFAKASDTGTTSPVDQTTYTANTTFGSGTQIGSTGWYTVYSGTGTSVDVTGLSNGTDYIFQGFEYNGDAGDELYITSSASNNPNDTTTLSQPGYEDFETGDLTTFEWTHGGNADWSVVETSPQEGSYCVGSGDIGNSQNSYMEVTLNILEAGNVSFYQKVSAEFCCDKLRFYVNDVLKGTYTNSAVWTQQTYAVSTGTTTFKWYYYKDGSVSSGSDMAWVDYIDFPKFIADTHTLSYSAGTGGSISGDSSQSISEGENGTEVIAVPDSGYSFVEWSDGSTSTTRTDTNITTTTAYSASFVDTTAPSINNVEYSYASSTGSTFTWNTNEAASSQIEYGFNNSYGFINAEENAESGVTSHSMDLSNLYPCTTFHFRTRSYDSSDNLSLGENATFTTAGCLGSAEVLTKYSSSAPTTTLTSLSLEEGTSNIDLNIPPSYSSSTAAEFQMKQLTTEDVITETGYPSGKTVVGYHTYSLQALLGANSALTTFEEPLTVTISYTDDEISGLEESTLGIQRWDDSSWNNLTGCSVDTPNNEVTCLTSNFSTFGLFGEEQQQEEEVDGSSSTTGGGILSPPSVPIINIQPIIINNTVTFNVSDAHQMTISDNEDFLNSGYESYNEKFLISKEYQDGFYVKFRNLDGGVSEVLYVSKKITEVPESTSQENRLIKYLNSPKVYFIQNNKKKWITDEQSFNYFNYNWSEVIIIKDHIIFENGENIVKPQEKIINKKEIQKTAYKFIKNLERGHIGEDVKELQKYLNNNGFPVVPEGYPGAKGIETEFFGYATQNALIKFQEAKGIKPAVGYFGLITRSLLD
ncbi:hypothetical protein HN682_05880, partial [Candidatus Peregrinibacteria bacterium]|nr:hypothetical protein [Candidatus Peregrinibacteria bacterium]